MLCVLAGRWRFACKEMHSFFAGYTSPGRNSKGYKAGVEDQHSTHSGKWDRNPLVAAMLEIKLSMTGHALDTINFDSLGLYDRLCGGAANIAVTDKDHTGTGPAGYRVPTNENYDANFDTYGDGGVPLTDFAPVVAYGSLEMLRSMRSADFQACPPGLYESDALAHQYCDKGQEYLVDEMIHRASYAPFRLQRDIWCDPHKALTVEQAVGNPEYFEEAVYDTEVKDRFRINNLVLAAKQRGEENIADKAWVKRSLRSWVFVTSSADVNVRAGFYRLLDLAVFRQQKCSTLPNVQCSRGVAFTEIENPLPAAATDYQIKLWKQQNLYYRTVRSDEVVRINAQLPLVDGLVDGLVDPLGKWLNGREALPNYRCSAMLVAFLGGDDPCEHTPYIMHSQCSQSDLTLQSAPTVYGPRHWFPRLAKVPSPFPPPPPPNPMPPPVPKPPPPQPPPPRMYDQADVMTAIRQIEERMCTSVYYLSQATRCERLAVDLTQRWLMTFTAPPVMPPLSSISPSPPPVMPPSPSMPVGFAFLVSYGATLSTFRLPVALPVGGEMDTFGYYTSNLTAVKKALAGTDQLVRACVPGAPLGCQSASLPAQCLNGGRRCAEDVANAESPWAEIRFKVTGGSYLWGLRITLPRNMQLSQYFVGTKTVQLWGARDEPLPCVEGNDEVVGVPQNWEITIVCHPPTATDLQLHQLSGAYRARITLTGSTRQVWFKDIQAIERPFSALATESVTGVRPAPSPPPTKPGAPPGMPPPPGAVAPKAAACTHYANTWIYATVSHRLVHEPCGQTSETCCASMHELSAQAYQIDDSGCCDLVYLNTGVLLNHVVDVFLDRGRTGAYSVRAGTGGPV